jgi:hypothetical protein
MVSSQKYASYIKESANPTLPLLLYDTLCCGRKAFSHLYFTNTEEIDTAKIGDLR